MRTPLQTALALSALLAVGPLDRSPALAAAPQPTDDLLLVASGSNLLADYLLANDTDPDGDELSIVGFSLASHGIVSDAGPNAIGYSPAPGYTGDDSFTIDVSDGETTVTSTVHVSVNAPFDAEAARDALLAGVTSLANPTQPGHMVAWGPTAQPISDYPGQDERDPMIVAATMGAGRVVTLPDHQWVNMDSFGDDPSTGTFYLNAITWLAGTADTGVKVVTAKVGAATWLGAQGYTDVVDTDYSGLAAELVDADVLVTWPGSSISQADVDAIVTFVKQGGGLLMVEYGVGYDWWWGKAGPDIPGNRVLRHAGIGFTKEWPASGAQAINRSSGQITDDLVAAVIQDPTGYTNADKERASVSLNRINASLADSDTLKARLAAVVGDKLESIVPTPDSPISDSLEKALLNEESQQLAQVPAEEMTAHRAALPVDPDAPRVDTTVTLAEPEAGHSYLVIDTGTYAAPGELIDITVPAALAGIGLQVQIGHLRTDTGDSNYYTMPYQQLFFDVDATTVQVASPHGGLLMFVAPADLVWSGDQPVQLSGVVEAPWFVLGEHTNADWLTVRDRGTPFGVLKCATTVLVIESEGFLRDLEDPVEVMSVWEPMIQEIAGFYAYDRGRELRIHHDYQPAGGVSAFPLSYGVSSVLTDSHALRVQGHPLTMHEHGHHADSGHIIFHEFGETSPNLGGKYAQWSYSNFAWKQELGVGRVNNYLFTLTDDLWNHFNHYRVDVKTVPFDSVAVTFGWESLKTVVHAITNAPSAEADTHDEKLDLWLLELGNETGFDMSPFFELWQLSFTEAGKAAVSDLPAWNMVELVGEDLITAQDTAITFGDPSVNDFSYDGALELVGVADPQSGSLVEHGNGTWTYTPASGFIGKDTLEYSVVNGTGNTFVGTLDVTVTAPADFPRVEAGHVHVGTSAWTTVALAGSFTSPVVIAQPALPAGSPPAVTRVRNAAASSFEVTLQRVDGVAESLDDIQVQYLVVEAGVYDVATHGLKMEAALVTSSVTDSAGDFTGQPVEMAHDDWDHYFIPVLFGQVMTDNDPAWSAFWAEGGALGYQIGKHVGEDLDTDRADETLGYVILDAGSLQIGGVRLQAGGLQYDAYAGFSNVDGAGTANVFGRMPALAGALVQSQGVDDDEDGYWTVLEAPVAEGNRVGARLTEDTLGDAEQGHGSLGGSYLLFADFGDGVTAIDDAIAAIQDTPNLVEVLTNDVSTFGTELSVASFGEPDHGTLEQNEDGTLTYTPDEGYVGTDRFYYSVTDGQAEDTGLVVITVESPAASEPGVLMETWFGLGGSSVSDLTGAAAFPASPDEVEVMPSWEAPVNRADSFGTRMRARLIVPETGEYTFWIASDDASQLWLGTDHSKTSSSVIASVSSWTSSQEWYKYASQQSAPVWLEAGHAYYMEALHKEGGGGDNLAVAWAGPSVGLTVIDDANLQTVGLNAPQLVAPLADVEVDEGAADSVIDVSGAFSDADPADPLELAVHAHSDPELVVASLVGSTLTLSYAPDANGEAELTLRATDRGGAMATDTFLVTVNPVDFPPEAEDATFEVAENAGAETPLGVVSAFDADPEQSLTFDIVGGNVGDAFAIDAQTGTVSVGSPLDFEDLDQYVLEIEVTDDAAVPGVDTATVTIDVLDVNEAPSLALLDAVTTLPEDTDTASPIATATVAVADDALGDETLSLAGADAALFELDGGTLWLKAGTALDFETAPTLEVEVHVDDPTVGDTPDDLATLSVEVTWVPVDECADAPCDANATCTDTPDAYTCECNAGYTGDGVSCVYDCAAADCSDGDPCTDDLCDGDGGCSWPPSPAGTVACDDGDACTGPDLCADGACSGEPIACDDDDACTDDACTEGDCVYEAVVGCCLSDADCVAPDACSSATCPAAGGSCSVEVFEDCCLTDEDCEPSEACFEAACPEAGAVCEETAIAGCCTEDVDCELSGACVEASCDAQEEVCVAEPVADCCVEDSECDDANPCTDDMCDPQTSGCQSQAIDGCCLVDADCDDGDPCTEDECDGNVCESTPDPDVCAEPNPGDEDASDGSDGGATGDDAAVGDTAAEGDVGPAPDDTAADSTPAAGDTAADSTPAAGDTGQTEVHQGDAGQQDTGQADVGTDTSGGGSSSGGCQSGRTEAPMPGGLLWLTLAGLWALARREQRA